MATLSEHCASSTHATVPAPHALIAAISGLMPTMFITRVSIKAGAMLLTERGIAQTPTDLGVRLTDHRFTICEPTAPLDEITDMGGRRNLLWVPSVLKVYRLTIGAFPEKSPTGDGG